MKKLDRISIISARFHHTAPIASLLRAESNTIGFLPTAAIREYIARGTCEVALHLGQVCGYVLGMPHMRYDTTIRPITHIVVHPLIRKRGVGTQLLTAVANKAREEKQTTLQAWTRNDLDAMTWWHRLEWTAVAHRDTSSARGHPATLWRLPLGDAPSPTFFDLPPVGGYRAASITAVPLNRDSRTA